MHKASDIVKVNRIKTIFNERKIWGATITPQTVVGAVPENVFTELFNLCIAETKSLLLLGYKPVGRGKTQEPYPINEQVLRDMLVRYRDMVNNIEWMSPTLSVDTCFVDKYGDLLKEIGVPDVYIISPEGKFSMYIDAVTNECGPSSYNPDEMVPITKSIKEHFKEF